MSSTIGQFDFTVSQVLREDQPPSSPRVVIILQRWGTDSDGKPQISADLMSDTEIDRHIRDLKDDLDAVAVEAKRALALAREAVSGSS
jgi:hypothetical protein